MHIISYYVLHTIKNSIKKLFRTKTGIVIIIVVAFVVFGSICSRLGGDSEESIKTAQELLAEQQKEAHRQDLLVIGAGVILLFFFLYEFASGSSKATGIFQMPDVNLLFAAPIRPQSVLLFRIVLQMGSTLVAAVFLLFQIPSLLKGEGTLGILLGYFFMLVLGMLCSILTYCVCTNHPKVKTAIRPAVYAILAGLLLWFGFEVQIMKSGPVEAGLKIFDGKWFYQIPFAGWIKGMGRAFLQHDMKQAALFGGLVVLSVIVLILLIYRTPVDFYEDAMTGAQKTQELLNASQEGRVVDRKRSEKVNRTEGIGAGWGANTFYYKSVYNHRRFAKFHLFTLSSQIYYLIGIGLSVFLVFVQKDPNIKLLMLILGLVSLFMSNGAILSSELSQNFIFLVPEKSSAKIYYCALSDLRNYLLDSMLPFIIACMILRVEPVLAAGCYLLLVAFYYISIQMGTWMDLLFPSSVAEQIKLTICYFLKFLAVIPAVIVFFVTRALVNTICGIYAAAIISFLCGAIFMISCPGLLDKGKK